MKKKPFIHMKAIPTFEFLKEQVETGYFEELIREYILDNPHGSIVIIRPEQGMTARMDKELADRLQAYKEGLSAEEIAALVKATKAAGSVSGRRVCTGRSCKDTGSRTGRYFKGDCTNL